MKFWSTDKWLTSMKINDKFMHMIFSFFGIITLYYIFYIFNNLYLFLIIFMADLIKEFLDIIFCDGFSWKDLVMDIIGIVFGLMVVNHICHPLIVFGIMGGIYLFLNKKNLPIKLKL